MPLLDEAHALVGTPPRTYDHVIVDEAQDLTPMQLRMIARRARGGALTILGDVAQGTGAVTYESWDDVLPHLPRGGEAAVEELRHAYRVPREIMELALPLLDVIAPAIERPLAYRVGGAEPVLRRVAEDELLREAYHEAARLAATDGLVALIVPDELVEPALAHESAFDGIPLLTPRAGEGPRVRPRDRRRAGARRRARAGPARALRRADAADDDARRRARATAARRARASRVCARWRSSGHRGWSGRSTTSSPGSTGRIEAFARSTSSSRRWSRSSSPTARSCGSLALAGAGLRLPHARAAGRGRRAAGADRPARRDPPAHAASGSRREQDRILAPQPNEPRRDRERDDVEPDVAGGDAARRVALRDAACRGSSPPRSTCRARCRRARARRRRGRRPRRRPARGRGRGRRRGGRQPNAPPTSSARQHGHAREAPERGRATSATRTSTPATSGRVRPSRERCAGEIDEAVARRNEATAGSRAGRCRRPRRSSRAPRRTVATTTTTSACARSSGETPRSASASATQAARPSSSCARASTCRVDRQQRRR